MNNQTEPFVSIQRRVISDKRNGKLSYREYELYVWIRLQATPYGIAAVSVRGILEDLPHFRSADNITKVLRSLQRKKFIYYPSRQGRGGSFEVHFGDWKRPDKTIKQLDKLFAEDKLRSSGESEAVSETEVGENSEVPTPKSESEKSEDSAAQSLAPDNSALRSPYNDTDTQNVNYLNELSKPIKRVATQLYTPKNDAERRCKAIALAVGDPYIHFILSVLNNSEGGGIEAVEEGYKQFLDAKRSYEEKGEPIKNPPALFNHCLKMVVETNAYESGLDT